MKDQTAAALALIGVLSLPGCAGMPAEGQAVSVRCAVTIPPMADFVEQVGMELVQVTLMVPAGASPHTHEPTPGQMSAIANADAYFAVGSGIEFELVWLGSLTAQNADMQVVDCSKGIEILNGDPHVWNSPANAETIVWNIAEGLSSADEAHADRYQANAEAYISQLEGLNDEIAAMFSTAENRHFLVYHPSFGYFAEEYDLIQLAIEEEGKATTPQGLQRTIDLALQHNLEYVFVEPQFATAEAESVAEALNGEIVSINPLPRSYIAETRNTAQAISDELE